jgi:formiminotetrahydrofolate cyclodeaminase
MKYVDEVFSLYFDDLSGKKAAPGGGSASAVVSLAGVSLLLMVANFTVGKEKYKEYEEEVKKIIYELEICKKNLQDLVDKDVECYMKFSEGYKGIKDLPGEQRGAKLSELSKMALGVPHEIIIQSYRALSAGARLADIGNKNLITDVACGVIFLVAGLHGAEYNVRVNLRNIKDDAFVNSMIAETKDIIEKVEKIRAEVIGKVEIELK